jgi:hypothetical protein
MKMKKKIDSNRVLFKTKTIGLVNFKLKSKILTNNGKKNSLTKK